MLRPDLDPELRYVHPEFDPLLALTSESLDGIRSREWEPPIEQTLDGTGFEHEVHEVESFDGVLITVSVFRKSGHSGSASPGIFNIHGGGMVSGRSVWGLKHVLEWVAVHDAVAASVEYRLAPEHPDPTPVEDVYAGLSWFADNNDALGFDSARLMVMGESAGGGLAAGAALLARDRSGPAVSALLLHCPMLDDRDRTVSTHQVVEGVPWVRSDNDFGWTSLLGDRRGSDDVSVYAAPSRAIDLSGLPPVFLDVGSVEVFRDEVVEFASRIWEAGGDAELHVWSGGFHGFTWWQPTAAVSRSAIMAADEWVGRQFRRR